MANKQLWTDYTNTIRDMNNAFEALIVDSPSVLGLVGVGAPVTNNKVEWLDQQISPTSFAITGFDTDGDGTGVNFASTTGMLANDIVYIESATGVKRYEVMKITSVDSATDTTMERDYGSTSSYTLVVGDVLKVTRPHNEASTATADSNVEPTAAYNYTEIKDRVAKLSRNAATAGIYGLNPQAAVNTLMNQAIEYQMTELMWDWNRSFYNGVKVARSATEAGTMGGVFQFLGAGTDKSAATLTQTMINDQFATIFGNGARARNYALVCNTFQARKISGFNTSGTNPLTTVSSGSNTSGQLITQLNGDFADVEGAFGGRIIVEPELAQDVLLFLDLDKLKHRYWATLTDKDATTPGADFEQRRLLMEVSLEVKNGSTAHGYLRNLAVS